MGHNYEMNAALPVKCVRWHLYINAKQPLRGLRPTPDTSNADGMHGSRRICGAQYLWGGCGALNAIAGCQSLLQQGWELLRNCCQFSTPTCSLKRAGSGVGEETPHIGVNGLTYPYPSRVHTHTVCVCVCCVCVLQRPSGAHTPCRTCPSGRPWDSPRRPLRHRRR